VYDPAADTWQPGATMISGRELFTLSPLPNGALLAAGGYQHFGFETAASEIYDPGLAKWSPAPDMAEKRSTHTATPLLNGTILVAGGTHVSLVLNGSELFSLDPSGAPCSVAAQCAQGFCVDHVCCDQKCDAPCLGCTAAEKGGGADGVCGPL